MIQITEQAGSPGNLFSYYCVIKELIKEVYEFLSYDNISSMNEDTINIYCDESHPVQNDGQDFMVIGALICEKKKYRKIKTDIQSIKKKHGVTLDYEFKWQKVNKKRYELYADLITYIVNNDDIRLKINLALGKRQLVFGRYEGYDYEKWYHNNYYNMLSNFISNHRNICKNKSFKLLIDKKDTNSHKNYCMIAESLNRSFKGTKNKHSFESISCNSREFLLIQCIDVIIGSVSYFHKKNYVNKYKTNLMRHIMEVFELDYINPTPINSDKVSFYVWFPKVVK